MESVLEWVMALEYYVVLIMGTVVMGAALVLVVYAILQILSGRK